MSRRMPPLSKSRFMAGMQCHKRLYLACHDRALADPVDAGTQARFDEGQEVGQIAHDLRPGGVLIEEDHLHPRQAMASTQEALSSPDVPALYEAAFEHEGVLIRVDILAKRPDGLFDLIEVKSSTKVKPEHKPDVGIQLWVLEGCGLPVERAMLAHIDNTYVYDGGAYDADRLFVLEDLTAHVREHQQAYVAQLQEMSAPLTEPQPPGVDVGPHCKKPYRCSFWTHCHANQPEHPIEDLYRLNKILRTKLLKDGVTSIDQIPDRYPGLSEIQQRMRRCVKSGQPYINPKMKRILQSWGRPLYFLDFETIGSALPKYANTRPYEPIPFQWSLHSLQGDGSIGHSEYLHDGLDDPRPHVVDLLLEAAGSEGKVVHYEPYEATMLTKLADAVPERATELTALATRLVDISAVIKDHCYHPSMHGSFSLKSVLPALLPGEGYGELDIADGTAASVAFTEMLNPDIGADRVDTLRANLIAYCRYDTEATLKIYQKLSESQAGKQ